MVSTTARIAPPAMATPQLRARRQTMMADARRLLARAAQARAGIADSDSRKVSLDSLVDNMKNDLDSMSEMGETESLRLQMAMDRLSKMMATLSNVLQKISDTAQSVTQNLK